MSGEGTRPSDPDRSYPGPGRGSGAPADNEPTGVIRTLRELPRPVVVLLVGIALSRTGTFVAVFLTLYLTQIGHSPARAGLALTIFGVGAITGTFASGTATGLLGPRRVIVYSMLLSGLSVAGLAVADSYTTLMLLGACAGLFGQMYRPAAATMMAALTPPKRLVMVSAATRLGLNVGAALGPLLGVWLLSHSFALMFLVNAVTHIGFAVSAMIALPDVGWARPETGHPRQAVTSAGGAPAALGGRANYLDLLRDRRFLLVMLAMFLTGFIESQYQAVLPLEILQRAHPTWLYGAVVALNGALVVLFELPLTRFIQQISMRTTISLGSLFIGLGLAMFGVPAGVWIFFAGVVVWTFGEIISAPSVVAYPALAAPTEGLRSRYIGALTTFQTAGYTLGPAAGTALFQYQSGAVWVMCAVLGVVASLGMWAGVRSPIDQVSGAAGAGSPRPGTGTPGSESWRPPGG
jgi:MFS family permease